jgi:hypothetical protein
MKKLHSKGYAKGDAVVWLLEGHQIDFSRSELVELVQGIKEIGILATLRNLRPSMEDTLRQIVQGTLGQEEFSEMDEATLQFLLEQCILDLHLKVSR